MEFTSASLKIYLGLKTNTFFVCLLRYSRHLDICVLIYIDYINTQTQLYSHRLWYHLQCKQSLHMDKIIAPHLNCYQPTFFAFTVHTCSLQYVTIIVISEFIQLILYHCYFHRWILVLILVILVQQLNAVRFSFSSLNYLHI